MNDFTKEELGIIYCNLAVNDKTKDVLRKITNMYENYCDHQWTSVGNHPWLHCIKCKTNFDY